MPANNLETTEEGYYLDARQGAVVKGMLDELSSKTLKYVDSQPVDIIIPNSLYTVIPNVPSGHTYLFATVRSWYNSSNPFSVHGSVGTFYVNAPSGTEVKGLKMRYWYMD